MRITISGGPDPESVRVLNHDGELIRGITSLTIYSDAEKNLEAAMTINPLAKDIKAEADDPVIELQLSLIKTLVDNFPVGKNQEIDEIRMYITESNLI